MIKRKGISLIVLVITIIVIIILSTAILVSVISNNPIEESNQARYESDVDSMQAVFTNTVAKIMAKNQGTVNVTPGKINSITSGVKQTTGEVSYMVTNAVNSVNEAGTIYFAKGDNTSTEFYTGKELPIYAAGETKWYVDDEGNITLDIAGKKYGNGETIVLEGEGQTYHTMAPSTLSFRSTADLDEFQEVQINGETIDPANYTLTEGSTIVTLAIDYLKTLDVDKHEITVVSKSGAPTAGFEVIQPKVNEYNFYYNQPYTNRTPIDGGFTAITTVFIREDGTADMIADTDEPGVSAGTATLTYEVDENTIIASRDSNTCNFTISENGTEFYSPELGLSFVLGDEYFVADEDYFYIYDDSIGGYQAKVIDETKSSYASIRTGINNKPTVSISETFRECENLTTIPLIPTSVTSIGCSAFDGCKKLSNIVLPSHIISIESNAFCNCDSLTSVGGIGSGSDVQIPDSIKVIKGFNSCKGLISVDIPDGINAIDGYAFYYCRNLSSITIPNTVTTIGERALDECPNLSKIVFEGTIEQWNAINKDTSWNYLDYIKEVVCIDGTVAL